MLPEDGKIQKKSLFFKLLLGFDFSIINFQFF
jgi:hypothetical protein